MSQAPLLRLIAAVCLLALGSARGADLEVRVDAREVARRHLRTQLTVAVQPGLQTLVFPKWIPGEHMPSGPLDSIIGITMRANGAPVAWQRDPLDMYALAVTVPTGATRLEVTLESGWGEEGGSFSASGNSSAWLAVLSWNQLVLLPKGRDAARITTAASVLAPPDWQLNCALALTPRTDGSVALEPASLERLIDSPLQMGRYGRRIELPGSAPLPQLAHRIAMVADSEGALVTPDDFAAGYGRLVAQAGALFGSRMYRHYTWLLSLSDHVAHFGLEHHESSDDRSDENSLSDEPLRVHVAELLAHEYVHSWNGKYRRPAGLMSPDYQRPMDGTLLWIYEGLTQFWGEVLPVRAGLVTPESYREQLAAAAGEFEIGSGLQWRPLADTAVEAQVLYESPTAWQSARRSTDFYDASQFLWLAVDAELRTRSAGSASLDEFMRRFYAGASGEPAVKPYVEADVYAGLSAIVPLDWRALTHRHLDTTGAAAMLAALEAAGWRLTYGPAKNTAIELDERRHKHIDRLCSIGLLLDDKDRVIDVAEGRAAARAGIGPGMHLIAVNGRRYTAAVLDAAIASAQQEKRPIALLVENADEFRTLSVIYQDGPRFPHLEAVPGRADLLSKVLAPRAD